MRDNPRSRRSDPGGFLSTVLDIHPAVQILGYTLPESAGGVKMRVPSSPNVTLKYEDITMFAEDMGVTVIPPEHPEAANFVPRQFQQGQTFDLVLCEGTVRRTHARADYREGPEGRRLDSAQLALGLEHFQPGGTMVVRLRKPEATKTASVLCSFSKFSSVQLFKPPTHHAIRSSFYMVATNVQNKHAEAIAVVEEQKRMWEIATFGTEEEYGQAIRYSDSKADEILEEFGSELVKMGRPIWATQAKALARAS